MMINCSIWHLFCLKKVQKWANRYQIQLRGCPYITPSNGYVGFPYHPLVRLIGPSVSACDHRPQKILGAANVDLGLVSSCEARANQTQVNILPPKFFVGLACVTRTKYPLYQLFGIIRTFWNNFHFFWEFLEILGIIFIIFRNILGIMK